MPVKNIPEYPQSNQPPKIIICTDGTEVLVDTEDYPLLSRHSWYVIGYANNHPYATTKMKTDKTDIKRCLFMHHLVLGTTALTDHKDRNTLNNQKHNLRPTTTQKNNWNAGKLSDSKSRKATSKYKGVSYRPIRGLERWLALIKHVEEGKHKSTGKYIYIGYFWNEIEAAKAYNKKVTELRGEYAWVNPIPEDINQAFSTRT